MAAWTETSCDTRRLENIPVQRRQDVEDEKSMMDQLMRARDVKNGAILSLVWENPELMAYVGQSSKFLNTERFGALPSHGRASKGTYAGRSCATVYGAW